MSTQTTQVQFPLQLQIEKDANGNITAVEITQDVADQLYAYYVSKLEQDNDFIDSIYSKIKEKLLQDTDFILKVRYTPLCILAQGKNVDTKQLAQLQQFQQQFTQMMLSMLPIFLMTNLMQAFQPRNGLSEVLEGVLPLLIIVPLLKELT